MRIEQDEKNEGLGRLTWAKRAMALTMSVLLSMTMTAPVPRPD